MEFDTNFFTTPSLSQGKNSV